MLVGLSTRAKWRALPLRMHAFAHHPFACALGPDQHAHRSFAESAPDLYAESRRIHVRPRASTCCPPPSVDRITAKPCHAGPNGARRNVSTPCPGHTPAGLAALAPCLPLSICSQTMFETTMPMLGILTTTPEPTSAFGLVHSMPCYRAQSFCVHAYARLHLVRTQCSVVPNLD